MKNVAQTLSGKEISRKFPRSLNSETISEGRLGEEIGGGYIIARRESTNGRIKISATLPFEHPSMEAAQTEAQRLSEKYPGQTYIVLGQMYGVITETETEYQTDEV